MTTDRWQRIIKLLDEAYTDWLPCATESWKTCGEAQGRRRSRAVSVHVHLIAIFSR